MKKILLIVALVLICGEALAERLKHVDFEEGAAWSYSDHFDRHAGYLADEWVIQSDNPHGGAYYAQGLPPGESWIEDSNFANTWPNAGWGSRLFVRFWERVPTNYALNAFDSCNGTVPNGGADWARFVGVSNWRMEWWSAWDIGPCCTHWYDFDVLNTGITISRDNQWHEYAWFIQMPTSSSEADGIFMTWKDDSIYTVATANASYTNIPAAEFFTALQFGMEYKGEGAPVCGGVPYSQILNMDDIEFFNRIPRTWENSPVAPNPGASGSTNLHYSRGNRRLARVGDTVILLVAEAISSENTYRSTDGGITWSLIDSDIAQAGALITGPANYVYHFFRSGTTLRMVKFLYHAATIPAPVTIFTDADISGNNIGVYRNTSASVDGNGVLYVAENWVNPANGEQTIYLISSADGGSTWSPKREVSAHIEGVDWIYQDVDVMTDNTVVVSYGQWDEGNHQFRNMVALSTDHGVTWQRHQVATTNWIYNPALLTVGSDTLYIFAQSGAATPLNGLVFSKSTNRGQSWSAWTLIDATCEYADPSAAVGEDNSILVTHRTNNFAGAPTEGSCGYRCRQALRRSTDGGASWVLVDDHFDAERVGTRGHLRYQTHFNYGGPLDWAWMQYINSAANLPTYFDSSDDIHIATDGGQSTSPTPTPSPTASPSPTPTPTPTPTPPTGTLYPIFYGGRCCQEDLP